MSDETINLKSPHTGDLVAVYASDVGAVTAKNLLAHGWSKTEKTTVVGPETPGAVPVLVAKPKTGVAAISWLLPTGETAYLIGWAAAAFRFSEESAYTIMDGDRYYMPSRWLADLRIPLAEEP